MDYIYTYQEEHCFLDDVERAVENISLNSLLSALYRKAYDETDVIEMNEYIGSCLHKMRLEYERMKKYRVRFLNTFATNDNKHYERRRALIGKMRISLSKIKWLCQMFHLRASRRDKNRRSNLGIAKPSVYDSSVLTDASSSSDLFGLETYPDCVKTLFDIMMKFRQLMCGILSLCREIMHEEAEYRSDPDLCIDILNTFRHKCLSYYNAIADAVQSSQLDCTEGLMQLREDCPADQYFAPAAYHNYARTDMVRLVVKEASEARARLGLTEDEQRLWGRDVEKVKLIRRLIAQFDSLMPEGTVFRGGKLPAKYIAMFMVWCGVDYTSGQVEKTFVRYFRDEYLKNGNYGMVDNSAVNKAKNSCRDWKSTNEYKKFERRINEVKSK